MFNLTEINIPDDRNNCKTIFKDQIKSDKCDVGHAKIDAQLILVQKWIEALTFARGTD